MNALLVCFKQHHGKLIKKQHDQNVQSYSYWIPVQKSSNIPFKKFVKNLQQRICQKKLSKKINK